MTSNDEMVVCGLRFARAERWRMSAYSTRYVARLGGIDIELEQCSRPAGWRARGVAYRSRSWTMHAEAPMKTTPTDAVICALHALSLVEAAIVEAGRMAEDAAS